MLLASKIFSLLWRAPHTSGLPTAELLAADSLVAERPTVELPVAGPLAVELPAVGPLGRSRCCLGLSRCC